MYVAHLHPSRVQETEPQASLLHSPFSFILAVGTTNQQKVESCDRPRNHLHDLIGVEAGPSWVSPSLPAVRGPQRGGLCESNVTGSVKIHK